MLSARLMLAGFLFLPAVAATAQPLIQKLGTLECDMVEAAPIVFKEKLYRFEYVRADYKYNA
ncbi:MAG: hypothetical protein IT367_10440, partial [Candidatus Hydrogenedentes bacterium]|nr:hypothetical protein [Candidatus Hydrogenedentota bacterium]